MTQDIEIKGVKIHYDVTGPESGDPVVLMHGWGCKSETVRSIAAALEDKMRVYNFDLPGHGKSEEPPAIWGVEDFTVLMEETIKALGIKKPSLVGHSFGGRIAILYSSRNDVDRIVLVDAAGVKPKRKLSYYFKVYKFKLLKKIIPLFVGKDRGEKWINEYRNKKGSADYNSASPRMKGILSKCVNEDLKSVMPDIKCPALLIWGEDDTATPLSDAKIMEKLIPDAGLVSFPACGHYSFLDNPFGFKRVIRNFFNDKLNK